VAAIELVLSGAGLPKVGLVHDGHPAGAGFQVVPLTGAAKTYAAVSWYKDGKPGKASDGLAEMLGACERALRRAGFHVEYQVEASVEFLRAWRESRL
jgi:hypothetical protein